MKGVTLINGMNHEPLSFKLLAAWKSEHNHVMRKGRTNHSKNEVCACFCQFTLKLLV